MISTINNKVIESYTYLIYIDNVEFSMCTGLQAAYNRASSLVRHKGQRDLKYAERKFLQPQEGTVSVTAISTNDQPFTESFFAAWQREGERKTVRLTTNKIFELESIYYNCLLSAYQISDGSNTGILRISLTIEPEEIQNGIVLPDAVYNFFSNVPTNQSAVFSALPSENTYIDITNAKEIGNPGSVSTPAAVQLSAVNVTEINNDNCYISNINDYSFLNLFSEFTWLFRNNLIDISFLALSIDQNHDGSQTGQKLITEGYVTTFEEAVTVANLDEKMQTDIIYAEVLLS